MKIGRMTPPHSELDAHYACLNVHELAGKFGYHARLSGTVAQLVEQGPFKALVLGSSPSRPTISLLPVTSGDVRDRPPN